MVKKAPKEVANLLAKLHDLVMELQDTLSDYSDEIIEDYYDLCDTIDSIEAQTSELDCDYNDYE